jgi:hypothetical protein
MRSERDSVHDRPDICREPPFADENIPITATRNWHFGTLQFVDDLQRFEQAPAGIGFRDPIKMHVWFDHANINGYDSHPLRMLTFSLHASGRAGPLNRRRRTTRFFIFPKIT